MSTPSLGSCCCCGTTGRKVRNIIMLHLKSPMPGRGWGCVVFGLPSDGASAVLCDRCLKAYQKDNTKLRWACRGYPSEDGRIPIAELAGAHDHDMSKHTEEKS